MPEPLPPDWQATVTLDMPFHDVDSAGVVWHGNYFKYFEHARSALLRRLDYDVPQMFASGYAWPVIESHCRHIAPLRYGDTIRVTARLLEAELRLKIGFDIRSVDGLKIARGHTIQVAVDLKTSEMCLGSPPILMQQLDRAWARETPTDGAAS